MMKNIPQKIYLQIGEDAEGVESFDDLSDVTWCADNINQNDIEYVVAGYAAAPAYESVLDLIVKEIYSEVAIDKERKNKWYVEGLEQAVRIINAIRKISPAAAPAYKGDEKELRNKLHEAFEAIREAQKHLNKIDKWGDEEPETRYPYSTK